MYSDAGIEGSDEVISYCRLGVRASYSWFILKYILGFDDVRVYDGSWTEWGNSAGVPIETDRDRTDLDLTWELSQNNMCWQRIALRQAQGERVFTLTPFVENARRIAF